MKPAQAQIEAADRLAVKIVSLVADAVDREGELGAYAGIECARKIKQMILDLAAAAEVGEETEWHIDMRRARAEERERCAQVADNWKNGASIDGARIAAAIRALKESRDFAAAVTDD